MLKVCMVLLWLTVLCKGDHPCHKVKKEYGYVCSCNSKHCDTISTPKRLPTGQFHLYSTSEARPGFNHEIGYFRLQPNTNNATFIEVDANERNQTVRGFGGAFTDSFGYNVNLLPKKTRENLLRSYFSEDGIEYTTCRVVLGSCDFSLRDYTYLPKHDPSMKSFHLAKDDHLYKIAHMRRAVKLSKRKMEFLGTSWSSPTWIHITNTTRVNYVKDEYKQLWADYHVKAIQAYKKAGLDFWGLTTGNEPVTLFSIRHYLVNMSAVVMFPEEQRDWVRNNLGPAIKKAGLKTSIFLLDDMRYFSSWWANTVMRDDKKENGGHSVSGIALHWYSDQFFPPEIFDGVNARHPELELIYTESSFNGLVQTKEKKNKIKIPHHAPTSEEGGFTPSKPLLGSWERGGLLASNIIENLNHWVTTYMDWNLALNTDGGPNRINFPCDSAILINTTSHEFYKQPIYYVMGHFSKFLSPGSVVIKLEDVTEHKVNDEILEKSPVTPYPMPIIKNENLQYVGVVNPKGSKSLVFYNPKPIEVEVVVRDPKRGHAHLLLEPNSINTVVYW